MFESTSAEQGASSRQEGEDQMIKAEFIDPLVVESLGNRARDVFEELGLTSEEIAQANEALIEPVKEAMQAGAGVDREYPSPNTLFEEGRGGMLANIAERNPKFRNAVLGLFGLAAVGGTVAACGPLDPEVVAAKDAALAEYYSPRQVTVDNYARDNERIYFQIELDGKVYEYFVDDLDELERNPTAFGLQDGDQITVERCRFGGLHWFGPNGSTTGQLKLAD